MKYDIATNFDPELIEGLGALGTFNWVYGKLNNDVVGGGRPSMMLPKISRGVLRNHVDLCHRNGLKFNYLINALCLSNKEFQKPQHRRILALLDMVSDLGMDGVTVASPYLCALVKKQYPHLFVSVSIYVKARTLNEVKYWHNLGADEVTLYHSVNRDFSALEGLLSFAKDNGPMLRLIGNNSCLHDCPFHSNHAVAHSHASRKGDSSKSFHIDYQILQCSRLKVRYPAKIISSEWIRPEDVHYYDELCAKVGTDKLSLKLTERGRTTKWLLRVANAYADRSYDGNLLDILNFVNNQENKQLHVGVGIARAIAGGYNVKKMASMRSAIFSPLSLYVDNKQLNGFMDKFTKGYACSTMVCDDGDVERSSGDAATYCSYCRHWAERAIRIDDGLRGEQLANLDAAIDDLDSSAMFHVVK